VIVRPYKPEDFDRLYEIDHAAFTEAIAYSHLELQYYLKSRRCRTLVATDDGEDAPENAGGYAAQDGGVIVGFVIGCSEPRKLGHIITIDVAPHRQRQHIGSRLLGEIQEWLWHKGAEAIYLETPVNDSGAQIFYEKHGYFVFERISDYYEGPLDAFVMIKTSRRAQPSASES
jgi:ribosomal protein S18 acetylase RimI-like enzyme